MYADLFEQSIRECMGGEMELAPGGQEMINAHRDFLEASTRSPPLFNLAQRIRAYREQMGL